MHLRAILPMARISFLHELSVYSLSWKGGIVRRLLNKQSGDSKAMSIFLLAIALVILLCFWKIGLPYLSYMRLSTFVTETVNYDRQNYVLDANMMRSMVDRVYNQALELNLPISEKSIQIEREDERAVMSIDYIQPVDMILFQFNMKMSIKRVSEGIGF